MTIKKKNITAVVLAAGRGSRFNADKKNKAVYLLAGRPMISYTFELLEKAGLENVLVVVGWAKESITAYFGSKYKYVEQKKRLGTAHAVKTALKKIGSDKEDILVLNADDSAFYPVKVIVNLIKTHKQAKADLTFLTVEKKNPNIARVLRDSKAKVLGVVEQQNLKKGQEKIKEINCGCYCFSLSFLKKYLPRVEKNKLSGEYYITQLIEIGVKNKVNIKTFKMDKEDYFQGINTKNQLFAADKKMRHKLGKKEG
jgi:bifunctional N-acetylglucosamine-1-phosphate-uridyltransferase/glucosamine-1-phosphate-acetyltransferase GlmU-like protein